MSYSQQFKHRRDGKVWSKKLKQIISQYKRGNNGTSQWQEEKYFKRYNCCKPVFVETRTEMNGAVKTWNDKVLGESSGHVNGEQTLNQTKTG